MIRIHNQPADRQSLESKYPQGGIERSMLETMLSSDGSYEYKSMEQLDFELALRRATVGAARALDRSGMDFSIFRKSRRNPDFWERADDGGFLLKKGVRPSDAIRDIFNNGPKYATECATAMVIVYYRAVLELFGDALFDRTFPKIRLMNWHYIDPHLREIGLMRHVADYLPGDRRYFVNPDVDPERPEWQGENVIVMGGDSYYGHGIGLRDSAAMIGELNQNRRRDATESAYLSEAVSRPDYKELFDILQRDRLPQPGGA